MLLHGFHISPVIHITVIQITGVQITRIKGPDIRDKTQERLCLFTHRERPAIKHQIDNKVKRNQALNLVSIQLNPNSI